MIRKIISEGERNLRQLLDRFRGNLPLALAAYNAGDMSSIVTALFRRSEKPATMSGRSCGIIDSSSPVTLP